MNGLLYVDKPVGITSHDVVAIVRRAAASKRVGHAGTLDPFASGLLVVAVGQCTRLLPYCVGEPKVYDATIRFGTETDTDDGTGATMCERDAPRFGTASVDAALANAIASLTGIVTQVPPSYSAKHVDGQRAYALARRGAVLSLAAVQVTVHAWSVLDITGPLLRARITCAGGTYVRALARDLGRHMGSAAHCAQLRRESSGPATVRHAVAAAELKPRSIAEGLVTLHSPLDLMQGMAVEVMTEQSMRDLRYGRAIAARVDGARAAFVDIDPSTGVSTVVGVGERTTDGRWQPTVVLLGETA